MTDDELTKAQKQLAIDLFNSVWDMLKMSERTQAEDDNMLHAAHASRYHWGQVGAPVNLARGEWQVSRVYSVLKRAEPALYHARRCLELCQENQIGDFDLAYAYEALARASAVAGDLDECKRYLSLALQAAEDIVEEEDKKYFLSDLETVPGYNSLNK